MKPHYRHSAHFLALTVASLGLNAQVTWDGEGADSNWSTAANWAGDAVPLATDGVQWTTAATVTVDSDVNQAFYQVTADAAGDVIFNGSGALTVGNDSGTNGRIILYNESANGVVAEFNNPVVIAGANRPRVGALAGDTLRFSGALILNQDVECGGTASGKSWTGNIEMGTAVNGTGALRLNAASVIFGPDHDSSAYSGQIVFLNNASLTIEEGAAVLHPGTKFQNNGTNASLILNGTEAINGANFDHAAVAGRSTYIDVNADNTNFGWLGIKTDDVYIDVAAGKKIGFAESSSSLWVPGKLVLIGFQEGLVRFGTTIKGLTDAQLAMISLSESPASPVYIDYSGYLTLTAPTANPFLDLFPEAVAEGDSWYTVDWIASGWIYAGNYPSWLLSLEHGWWYGEGASYNRYWFYDMDLGWIFTAPTAPNFYFRSSDGAWLWHQPDTGVYGAGRSFYNYQTSVWEAI